MDKTTPAWEEIQWGADKLNANLKIAPTTHYSQDNKYGMYLSPEEMQNRELMRQLDLHQQALLKIDKLHQEAMRYSHGWHDARSTYAQSTVKYVDIMLKERKPWPKIQPAYYFLVVMVILCIIGIAYETI